MSEYIFSSIHPSFITKSLSMLWPDPESCCRWILTTVTDMMLCWFVLVPEAQWVWDILFLIHLHPNTHTHIHCCSNLHNYKSSTSTQSLISISASHTQSIKNKEVGVRNCCAHKQKQNWARKGNSTRDKEGGVTKCWRDREDKTEEKQRDHRHERKRSNHRESLPYLWPSQLQPQSM